MKLKICIRNKGFIAVTAVVLLAMGTLAFALATASAVTFYSDSIMRNELRIQADLNAQSCLATVELMSAKDYFLQGIVQVKEFNCSAGVSRLDSSHVSINVTATLYGAAVRKSEVVEIDP